VDVTEQIINAFIDHWALIAGIVILIGWLLRTFFPKFFAAEKGNLPQSVVVQLDPATADALREIGEVLKNIASVTLKTDADGVPLVYSDRKQEAHIARIADLLKDIADAQRHLAESMARLDKQFADHDRSDAIVFSRMADAQTRLEAIGNQNRESLIVFAKDHHQALKALDEIKREHQEHDQRVMKAIALQEEIANQVTKK